MNSWCERARAAIRATGLDAHEDFNDCVGADLLGLEITGTGLVSGKFKRRKRLYGALSNVFRIGRISSKQLSVVLGKF